jgi:MFS family permease
MTGGQLPAGMPAAGDNPHWSAWYSLGVLTVVLLFATVDRAVLILLAQPVKESLGLTDLQLGLVQGTGIAVFAALATFPIGWLADRIGRRAVLAGSVLVWSLAVVGCGLAQNFEQLFLASAMVGAGEAGLAPITYTLIAELFRGPRRQLANSVFVVASATGGGLGMMIAGQLVGFVEATHASFPAALSHLEPWRVTFFVAALPAPLMMLLIGTIRLTQRILAAGEAAVAAVMGATLREHLYRYRGTLIPFYAGVGMVLFSFAAIGAWLAVICMRLFGQTATQVGSALGLISIVSVAVGFVISAFGLRYFAPRLGSRLQIRTMWTGVLMCVGTSFALGFADSALQVYLLQAFQGICLTAANMLYPTALQDLAPSHLRTRVIAIQSALNVAFAAMGPPVVGLLSDSMQGRPDALLVAASAVATCGLLVAAALLWWCERSYGGTIEGIARDESILEAQPQSA